LVWVLLFSWASILYSRFFPNPVISALTVNVSLSLSICYGFQGLAVLSVLAEHRGMASVTKLLVPTLLIFFILNSTIGIIIFGMLVLLGTLETWIDFRTVKKGVKS
jgi:hypothetical protein